MFKVVKKVGIALGGATALAALVAVGWRLSGNTTFPDPLIVTFFFAFLLVGVLMLNALLE